MGAKFNERTCYEKNQITSEFLWCPAGCGGGVREWEGGGEKNLSVSEFGVQV